MLYLARRTVGAWSCSAAEYVVVAVGRLLSLSDFPHASKTLIISMDPWAALLL
jgi:hypothetical protein